MDAVRPSSARERGVGAAIALVVIIAAAVTVAIVAARRAVRTAWDGLALLTLTLLVGLPLWVTCDQHVVEILPTVGWFDPAEPFAPYFLLYLPLSLIVAVTLAAVVISATRLCAMRLRQALSG
jgi:hypothetical protein